MKASEEQALAWNFTESNTPSWVFFTFFKLYKSYQIPQRITVDFLGYMEEQSYLEVIYGRKVGPFYFQKSPGNPVQMTALF